jgi:hypothetical protein
MTQIEVTSPYDSSVVGSVIRAADIEVDCTRRPEPCKSIADLKALV